MILPGFTYKCSFRQYVPQKPSKYGIKIFAFVDAKMTYTYNMEIYAGKQPEDLFCVSNKPTDVVRSENNDSSLFGSGGNITGDN